MVYGVPAAEGSCPVQASSLCAPAASWATLTFSPCVRGSPGSLRCFDSLSWCLSLRGAEVPDLSLCLPPGESLTVLSEAFKVSPSVWHFASGGYRLSDVLTSLFHKIIPPPSLAGCAQSWGKTKAEIHPAWVLCAHSRALVEPGNSGSCCV